MCVGVDVTTVDKAAPSCVCACVCPCMYTCVCVYTRVYMRACACAHVCFNIGRVNLASLGP